MIKSGPVVISGKDSHINEFVEKAIEGFISEFEFFIKHNNDPEVLGYFLEGTYLSIMLNGLVRQDGSKHEISIAQEYSTYKGDNNKNGRADAFVRYGDTGIWIESKKEYYERRLKEGHWDIDEWLIHDEKDAFKQLRDYYIGEKIKEINTSYASHCLMTLMFKRILENPNDIFLKAEQKLAANANKDYTRGWYYSVLFIEDKYEGDLTHGLEVYGTFEKVK